MYFSSRRVGCQVSLAALLPCTLLWPVRAIFSVCLEFRARFILGHWVVSNFIYSVWLWHKEWSKEFHRELSCFAFIFIFNVYVNPAFEIPSFFFVMN